MNPLRLLWLIPIVLVVWAVHALQREAQALYAKIDEFQARAKAARTVEELNVIAKELCDWANAKIWHRTPAAAARAVLTYIQGKRDALRAD